MSPNRAFSVTATANANANANTATQSKATRRWPAAALALALAAAGVLAACTPLQRAPFNHAQPNSPQALQQVPKRTPAPKIALVLGSGGPRGYAHIGVLQVLEEAGIVPDMVVGSSVGALIGAFWAAGRTAQQIDALAQTGGPLTVFDFSAFADRGWIHGQRLQDFVSGQLQTANIEDLPRPFVAVATRMADKQPVFFNSGSIAVAVRASSAVHRIFSPVGIQGVEYEDADESLPVAVRAARQAGAQWVIAVDVTARPGSAPVGTSAQRLDKEARRRARTDPELALADVVLHPDMGFATRPTPAFFRAAQQAGRDEAVRLLPVIQRALTLPPLHHAPAPQAQAQARPAPWAQTTGIGAAP